MAHIRLFNTDTFIDLAPRWGESHNLLDWGPWLLVGLVPIGLVVWLYRYEIRLVGGIMARGLLALRLLVLALLLFLVFWQPRVGAQVKEKLPDRVLVVIDRTGSMDVADPNRPTVEKLRLARALKLCPDIVPDKLLDLWIATSEDKTEPQWIADNEAVDDADARRRLEDERRQQHQKVCARVDKITRTELVQRLLDADSGRLLQDLGGRFQVQVLGFDDNDVREVAPDQWKDLFAAPAEERLPGFTNLMPPLERVLQETAAGGGAVRGVILIGDGRQNKGDVPTDIAERLGQRKATIFPVVVGSAAERPSVNIASIIAPRTILKDPEDSRNRNVVIKASIRVRAVEAQPLVVELYDGKTLLRRKTIKHVGGDNDYEVIFPTALREDGTHKLTVKVQPPPGLKEKAGLERNYEIHVVADQAEALVIDGEMRWESHYLTVALGRDKLVKPPVSVVAFEQPRIQRVIDEAELRKMNVPLLKLPEDPAALTAYDCIVLGDVPPDKLPLKDRERLQSYVRDAGGTLVIVAGKGFMPVGYPKEIPDDPNRTDPITAMLPISQPRVINSRQGFPVTLTDEGQLNVLLQLSDEKDDDDETGDRRPNLDIWKSLPPHYWAVVGKKKPAATTLAYYPGEPEERGAGPMKKADQEARSLIAWQSYGRGRVLFVGLDSTWRWRYKVGDQHHYRFWGQLVRWATTDKLLPGGAGKVRFGTPKPTYEPGEEIEVRVRLDKTLPEPGPKESVAARIIRVDGDNKDKVAALTLLPRTGQPRTLEGKLRDLPPGSYRVELDFGDLSKKLVDIDVKALNEKAGEFVIVAPPNEEMTNLTTDPVRLQTLAILSRPELKDPKLSDDQKKTAVKVYTPENAHEILDQLKRADEEEPIIPGKPLWEWWPTLVVVLGLLTVEWVARKWSGLP
jgi:hypothetical protein